MSSSYRAALGYREPASRRDYSRNIVGRDFMSNRPRYGEYGDMDRPPEHEVAGHEAARVDLPEDEYARRREYFHRGDYESDWSPLAERYLGYSSREHGLRRPIHPAENRSEYGTDWGAADRRFYGDRTAFDETIAGRAAGFEARGEYWGDPQDYWNERMQSQRFRRRRMRAEGARAKSFEGVGPRGYQRSDERIREDVCQLLTDHPDIDASNIEVRVNSGAVTLNGNVENRFTKKLAENVVEQCCGIRDVHNQLRISQPSASKTSSVTEIGKRSESSVLSPGEGI